MKELAGLFTLLVAVMLIVLILHAWMVGLANSHPTYIYYYEEEAPAATATIDDSIPGNSNGWSYYPVSGLNYVGQSQAAPPTMPVSGGGRNVRN